MAEGIPICNKYFTLWKGKETKSEIKEERMASN